MVGAQCIQEAKGEAPALHYFWLFMLFKIKCLHVIFMFPVMIICHSRTSTFVNNLCLIFTCALQVV